MRLLAIVAVFGCDAGTRVGERNTRDTVVAAPQDAVAAVQDAQPADTSDKLVMEYQGNSRIGDIDKQVIRNRSNGTWPRSSVVLRAIGQQLAGS